MSDFIEQLALLVQKYAPEYGIAVCSPIIAQGILESARGTSNKVALKDEKGNVIEWRHNYFGLKWRNNRCAISNDYFEEQTAEQKNDGSYINIVSKFCKFKSMEECVIGYFQWTNIPNYANLKGVTDPETYLRNIKADKYATSIDYVENLMQVIRDNNLTQYDKKEVDKMIKIGIDAGHGSETAGKRTPDGHREHWINVRTAYYLEQELLRMGFKTVRIAWDDTNATDDKDISLSARQNIIKAAECDYSVSVHANAYGNGKTYNSAQGVSTHIHNNSSYINDSLELANCIQNRIIEGTNQKNRGVVRQALAMCNCKAMGTKASCLVEIGFMTNKVEADLMKTDSFCKEQGEDIARGIADYIRLSQKVESTQQKPQIENNAVGTQSDCPFLIQCLDDLNIRKTAGGTIVKENGCKKGTKYTIVKVSGKWGYLKSGAGWISISSKYVKRV